MRCEAGSSKEPGGCSEESGRCRNAAPSGGEQRAQLPQIDGGAAEAERELGELIGLELSIAGTHLCGELADPALDPKLFRLERVGLRVAVRKRALEACSSFLVVSRRALAQR